MAWSVHTRQIRLAELLVRRQFLVIADAGSTDHALDEAGGSEADAEIDADGRARLSQPAAIEGPDNVVTGEQARYRVRTSGPQQVVSWAVGGARCRRLPTWPIPTSCC